MSTSTPIPPPDPVKSFLRRRLGIVTPRLSGGEAAGGGGGRRRCPGRDLGGATCGSTGAFALEQRGARVHRRQPVGGGARCSGLSGVAVAAGWPGADRSGTGQRGALPLRLPGLGAHQRRDRQDPQRDELHAEHPPVHERLRGPLRAQVHREQRWRHLQRGDGDRRSRSPRSSTPRRPTSRRSRRTRRPPVTPPSRSSARSSRRLLELLQQGLRALRPPGGDQADHRDRELPRRGARPGPGPGVRGRDDDRPARCTRSARPGSPTSCRAAAPTRSPTAPPQQHLVEFEGNPYFGENVFQGQNPYVWSTVPSCTNIAAQMAEVIGKELAGKKADLRRRRPSRATPASSAPSSRTCNVLHRVQR